MVVSCCAVSFRHIRMAGISEKYGPQPYPSFFSTLWPLHLEPSSIGFSTYCCYMCNKWPFAGQEVGFFKWNAGLIVYCNNNTETIYWLIKYAESWCHKLSFFFQIPLVLLYLYSISHVCLLKLMGTFRVKALKMVVGISKRSFKTTSETGLLHPPSSPVCINLWFVLRNSTSAQSLLNVSCFHQSDKLCFFLLFGILAHFYQYNFCVILAWRGGGISIGGGGWGCITFTFLCNDSVFPVGLHAHKYTNTCVYTNHLEFNFFPIVYYLFGSWIWNNHCYK